MFDLDLSRLHPSSVVHCETEDQALGLIRYLKEHHPKKVSNWEIDETNWDRYERDTVYYLYWGRTGTMKYGSIHKVNDHRVMEFDELIIYPDLETHISDLSIESLFG